MSRTTRNTGTRSALQGSGGHSISLYDSVDFGQARLLGDPGKTFFLPETERRKAILHTTNPIEQSGVDQGRHGFAVLLINTLSRRLYN